MVQTIKRSNLPYRLAIAAFLVLLVVTEYIAYQRYLFIQEEQQEELQQTLEETKSRFKDVLTHNISSANTLAILYKQNRGFKNFDSIAKQIISCDSAIAFLAFVEQYKIKYVYPLPGNEMIVGRSLQEVPILRREAELAIRNKDIHFAGPYEMAGHRGIAIACRIAVITDDTLQAVASAVTKLTTIQNLLPQLKNHNGKFVFQLTKENPLTHKTEYFFPDYVARDKRSAHVYIPEGNWTLSAAYSAACPLPKDAYFIALLGFLFSLSAGLVVYHRAKLPAQLEHLVTLRTNQMIQSEARFRGAFEHGAIGMALVDLEGKWLMVNNSICDIVGYSQEEMLGMTVQDITHPDDIQSETELLQRATSGEIEHFQVGKRYLHKDGSIVWVNRSVSLIRDTEKRPMYLVCQIENVTERLESQQKLQSLVENSLVGVYILQDDRFAYVNPAMIRESGYTEEELKNMTIDRFVHKDDIPIVVRNVHARFAGEIDNARYELRVYKKTGEMVWVELFGSITTLNGKAAIIGAMVNITERKQLEIERQKIIQDLLERNEHLEQFTQIISHNVRAQVARLLALSGFAKEELDSETHMITMVGIEESAQQLDAIIRDLNNILHARSGLAKIKTVVKLDKVLAEVKKKLHPLIEGSKATIVSDFSAVDEIETVRPFINSIFFNLISNSIKYSRDGVVPHIQIKSEKRDDRVVFHFSDNGMGMDMDKYKDKLFMLYQRFHPYIEGNGIGLFMIKTQVDSLNGDIEVVSKVGHGSTFKVYL